MQVFLWYSSIAPSITSISSSSIKVHVNAVASFIPALLSVLST